MHNIYLIDELTGITTIVESKKCNMTEFDEFICFWILYNLSVIQIIGNHCERLFHDWYNIDSNYYTCIKHVYDCDGCSYSLYNCCTTNSVIYMTELSYISGINATAIHSTV